ncbi:hypothetical protein PO430_24210, partial [Escherichia coli]
REKQKGSRGIRRGQRYRLVFQFPIRQDEWLIAVDLQCGSPWNAAAMLAMRNPRLRVISGLSLPLALELVDNQDSMNVDELCEHLTQIAKQSCVVWRQVATAEEDF